MHTQVRSVYIYCHFNITNVTWNSFNVTFSVLICVLARRNPPLYKRRSSIIKLRVVISMAFLLVVAYLRNLHGQLQTIVSVLTGTE